MQSLWTSAITLDWLFDKFLEFSRSFWDFAHSWTFPGPGNVILKSKDFSRKSRIVGALWNVRIFVKPLLASQKIVNVIFWLVNFDRWASSYSSQWGLSAFRCSHLIGPIWAFLIGQDWPFLIGSEPGAGTMGVIPKWGCGLPTVLESLACFFFRTSRVYPQTSHMSRSLVGNNIVDHSDVVGASLRCSWSIACRRCSNYIFILD